MYRDIYQPAINEAYVEALYFTDVNEDSDFDNHFDCELSPEALAKCNADCCDFVDLLIKERLFKKTLDIMTPEQIGHDFWLTRNGHGAGFWDRGIGELGVKLSDLAKTFGAVSVYQDGKFNIQIG
jgi:hypothetical protein